MGATRPASGIKAKAHTPAALITHLSVNLYLKNPDAGRVAPISGSVLCLRLVVAFLLTSSMRHPSNNVIH